MPAGHPEGYIEGFANLYSDAAQLIWSAKEGNAPDPGSVGLPTVEDGARGLRFIEACAESSRQGGVWVPASLDI
jgi:predicted dehydrogenase